MVHAFNFGDKHLLFDVESGTLMDATKIAYNIVLSDCGQTNFLHEFSEEEIALARAEIEELKATGLLFAPEKRHSIQKNTGEFKSLCLHICHDCNLACGYCFASQGNYGGKRSHMSLDVAKKSVDFLIANSGKRHNLEIDFFGGEPLLNFDVVKQTVEYAKGEAVRHGKEFKFTVTTNALLLTDDTIDYLDREMDNVVVSIDGRKAVHDKMRPTAGGMGSHDIVVKNALRFAEKRKKSGKDYYIRGTFTADNLDFAADVEYLVGLGFDRVSIEPVVLPVDNPLALNEGHLSTLLSEYDKLAQHFDTCRKADKPYVFFHFMIDLSTAPCVYKRLRACGAGCEYGAVTPEGDIYPCHQFVGVEEYLMGNVAEGIVNRNVSEKFADVTVYDKKDCDKCFAKYHCSGGCFANSHFYAGDFVSHEPLGCELMRKRLECALFLYAKTKLL